ncbi:response regulator [soil metagenome]
MTKKILVVDDSRTIRQLVSVTLKDIGYDVIEAVDGVDGLLKLDANADTALVLCDVNMPNKSGLEMLSDMKSASVPSTVPVVMLTTESQLEMLKAAKLAGAVGWIVKPFKGPLFVAAVRKLIGDG